MAIWDHSKTPAENTSVEDVSWAEGMAPGNVNDGFRAYVAALKKWQEDTGGALEAGGTANALTLTTNGGLDALEDGVMLAFRASASNTSAATLNVDTLGAKAIRRRGDEMLVPGDILEDGHYLVQYNEAANSAAGAWLLLNSSRSTVEIISSATVTDVATVDFTNLSSTYRAYELVFHALLPATNAVLLQMRVSTDNGSNFHEGATDYSHVRGTFQHDGTTSAAGSAGASSILLFGAIGNTVTGNFAGKVTIYSPGTNDRARVTGDAFHLASSGNYIRWSSGGQRNAAGIVNAVRFMFSSGNIATMRYTLYGLRA